MDLDKRIVAVQAKIGHKLKTLIKEDKMTVKDVAIKCKVAPGCVNNILHGRNFEIRSLIKICHALKYNFYHIMDDHE